MIEIKNVSKTYNGKKKALKDVSFTVNNGEIFAFIGHNGAGKTTMIKSLIGILDFEEGEILINKKSIKDDPIACKKEMAYVPDNPDLYENMKAIDFINFVLDMYDIPSDTRKEKIEKYVGICKKEGITILAPDINISGKDFTPIPEKQQIYFGFSSIKGIGETAAEEIIKNRPFEKLQEIFEKLPKKIMNKRVAIALAKSGALDNFDKDKNRYNLINQIYDIRKDKDERLIPIR